MKKYDISIKERDGDIFYIVERSESHCFMYSVEAKSEEDALHLFNLNSHKVKFVGSLVY